MILQHIDPGNKADRVLGDAVMRTAPEPGPMRVLAESVALAILLHRQDIGYTKNELRQMYAALGLEFGTPRLVGIDEAVVGDACLHLQRTRRGFMRVLANGVRMHDSDDMPDAAARSYFAGAVAALQGAE